MHEKLKQSAWPMEDAQRLLFLGTAIKVVVLIRSEKNVCYVPPVGRPRRSSRFVREYGDIYSPDRRGKCVALKWRMGMAG
jgi:hypothetical protein